MPGAALCGDGHKAPPTKTSSTFVGHKNPTGDGGVFLWVMRLNLIERLSLELVGPLQPSLEQFLDHPGHARLFAGGEVAERDDAISALSHRHLSSYAIEVF